MIEAGTLIVKILEKQNVERVFCVPGESYLSVMNGLQDTSIETILCKHEGGASITVSYTHLTLPTTVDV